MLKDFPSPQTAGQRLITARICMENFQPAEINLLNCSLYYENIWFNMHDVDMENQ